MSAVADTTQNLTTFDIGVVALRYAHCVYAFFKEFLPLSLAAFRRRGAEHQCHVLFDYYSNEFPALHDNELDNVLLSPIHTESNGAD